MEVPMLHFLIRSATALLLSSAIAGTAFSRKSLNRSGALSGFLVMTIHIACSSRFGALLLVFFFTSSVLTKFGEGKKRSVDEDFKEGGQRNWIQVLANSALASILSLIVAVYTGGQERCLDTKDSTLLTALIGGIIGHYACCNGDTWSSEIGMLSNAQPRLITTFKKVRKGTNGAVSFEGLLAAAAGGFVIGLAFVIVGWFTVSCPADVTRRELLVIPIATFAGLCGSLIDSVLGATFQFSGYCSLRKKVQMKNKYWKLHKTLHVLKEIPHKLNKWRTYKLYQLIKRKLFNIKSLISSYITKKKKAHQIREKKKKTHLWSRKG